MGIFSTLVQTLVKNSFTLTHWGRVTHICVSKLTIIDSDNGLSPGQRQAVVRTNVGILLILTWRTHFSEISSEIQTFSFKQMHSKMSSANCQPFCLGLNVSNILPYWPFSWGNEMATELPRCLPSLKAPKQVATHIPRLPSLCKFCWWNVVSPNW